ncbi:asparaginase [Pseudomonas sichuanensis]|uniref:asparaginase n=1 Tax=Pseudomonas sichuanensis TaxID=2213015 RepID=UPI00244814E8|nr:asparaginase [Pseudomonas sichuanensis]MDH0732903.1 asparaginase [Pseudomonas sichuanensis]MDH1581967.1 asparaginase [Pseudomonas sichuanensis]MDH1591355.1 asparaginase [Pseudomonas sichuanensis]MDH1596995.1 asparaginase [Pseudomonas sichuanensis]
MMRLSVGSLGGTVSMQAEAAGQGVMPKLDCEALLAMLPQLRDIARIRTATLCLLPSASLSFQTLLEVLAWAREEIEGGAQAVVLTQGTDTLEETAWFLDLLWPFEQPLIITGAMRSASQPGTDGPANLLAAVHVALNECSRGRGVLVVINDQIHAAAAVRKTASLAMAAFESPGSGPVGVMVEGVARFHHPPLPRQVLSLPARTTHRVALLEACLDADAALLQVLPQLGYEGLVVAGFGAGHVSLVWAEAMTALASHMPVIVATRTGSGPTARSTYGFVGGEIDLQAKGMRMAGALCPRKCRILLWLLIGAGDVPQLEQWLPR